MKYEMKRSSSRKVSTAVPFHMSNSLCFTVQVMDNGIIAPRSGRVDWFRKHLACDCPHVGEEVRREAAANWEQKKARSARTKAHKLQCQLAGIDHAPGLPTAAPHVLPSDPPAPGPQASVTASNPTIPESNGIEDQLLEMAVVAGGTTVSVQHVNAQETYHLYLQMKSVPLHYDKLSVERLAKALRFLQRRVLHLLSPGRELSKNSLRLTSVAFWLPATSLGMPLISPSGSTSGESGCQRLSCPAIVSSPDTFSRRRHQR